MRKDKYLILGAVTTRDLTARQAAAEFALDRHTVEKWCREAGIPLTGHRHPRVSHILSRKKSRMARLLREQAVLQREIAVLQEQDPGAPYIKPAAPAKRVKK